MIPPYLTTSCCMWMQTTVSILYRHIFFIKQNNKGKKHYANTIFTIQFVSAVFFFSTTVYGYAMSQYMPMKNFDWCTEEQINSFDVTKIADNCSTGYILEVDLDYPEELHQVKMIKETLLL